MNTRSGKLVVICGIALAAGAAGLAADASAQSGLEASRELSGDAKKAEELLKQDDKPAQLPDLSRHGIDRTPDPPPGLLPVPGTAVPGTSPPASSKPATATPAAPPTPAPRAAAHAPAQPGYLPLVLMNCSGRPVTVRTFNATDNIMAIPYEARPIPHAQAAHLRCATREHCKVMIDGTSVRTGVLTGYQVFIRGGIRPTSDTAMGAGCVAQ